MQLWYMTEVGLFGINALLIAVLHPQCQYSSVVEQPPAERQVVGSNPTVDFRYGVFMLNLKNKIRLTFCQTEHQKARMPTCTTTNRVIHTHNIPVT